MGINMLQAAILSGILLYTDIDHESCPGSIIEVLIHT